MSTASRTLRGQRGLTIVELIIFIVVVSVALVGVLVVMNVTSQHSGDAQLRKQALSIAEALLEEVESARFTYCDYQDANVSSSTLTSYTQCASIPEVVGPEGGNTRPYDNVNDYVTKFGTQQAISLNNANGVTITGLTGNYVPCITITSATLDQMEADGGANPAIGSALLIKIDVYNGTGIACGSTSSLTPVVTLEGVRTQYAPNVPP